MRALLHWIYQKTFGPFVEQAITRHLLLEPHIFGGDPKRVQLHPTVKPMNTLFNVSSGKITVEKDVTFGHNVSVLTGWHDPSRQGPARGENWAKEGHDILIREGVWLASNVTVVGPAEIGAHAVIAAGAVVTGNIPARVMAGGVPAKVIKDI
jgi:acetyltransferase-like isoleucine patch superfamily enzyme